MTVQLRNLREWREEYYNGTPLVPDAVYDAVEDRIRADAKQLPDDDELRIEIDEFLARVGAPAPSAPAPGGNDGSKWKKAKHLVKMGSLNKAQPQDQDDPKADHHVETRAWLADCLSKLGVSSAAMVWSDKCDGISIALYYTGGKLTAAVTRGDGEEGEDITRNVLKMKGVVPVIKDFEGFIRGEVVLRKTDWKAHFPEKANPRNAASGIAKRESGIGPEHLTVLHYQMIRFGGKRIPDKATEFKLMKALGCELPSWGVATDLQGLLAVYQRYIDGARGALDYDIDGLVFEFSSPDHMGTLGERNNRPRGAVAYKFPHAKKATVLRDVRWQVGNTGRITPVAHFDTVNLAGANVSKASLHNLSNIAKLTAVVGKQALFVGDGIIVSRRNDVIPYVEQVLTVAQGGGVNLGEAVTHPTTCPTCGADTERDGEFLICPDTDFCPSQVAGAIKAWVRKIGLKGVGTSLIDALCEEGIIQDAADLYTLDHGELADFRMKGIRVGGTSDTVMAALEGKKDLALHVFVGSQNIKLCSRSTCQTIADAGFDTLDKMRAATEDEISAISGMGATRGKSFVAGLIAKQAVMDKLMANGITIKAPAQGILKGVTVCFTGVRDSDLEEAIEGLGGTIKSSAGKTLGILVAKSKVSTSGKAKKARANGTEVVDLDEMWDRVGGRP
jgi:DNA ligase (NAD+)